MKQTFIVVFVQDVKKKTECDPEVAQPYGTQPALVWSRLLAPRWDIPFHSRATWRYFSLIPIGKIASINNFTTRERNIFSMYFTVYYTPPKKKINQEKNPNQNKQTNKAPSNNVLTVLEKGNRILSPSLIVL